jgi:hypothetical protein
MHDENPLTVTSMQVHMRGPARTTAPKALTSAEREWIRRQGRVSRALEAAQRRSTGRFSRVTTPSEATIPASRHTPA